MFGDIITVDNTTAMNWIASEVPRCHLTLLLLSLASESMHRLLICNVFLETRHEWLTEVGTWRNQYCVCCWAGQCSGQRKAWTPPFIHLSIANSKRWWYIGQYRPSFISKSTGRNEYTSSLCILWDDSLA